MGVPVAVLLTPWTRLLPLLQVLPQPHPVRLVHGMWEMLNLNRSLIQMILPMSGILVVCLPALRGVLLVVMRGGGMAGWTLHRLDGLLILVLLVVGMLDLTKVGVIGVVPGSQCGGIGTGRAPGPHLLKIGSLLDGMHGPLLRRHLAVLLRPGVGEVLT